MDPSLIFSRLTVKGLSILVAVLLQLPKAASWTLLPSTSTRPPSSPRSQPPHFNLYPCCRSTSTSSPLSLSSSSTSSYGDASFMVKEFSSYQELEEIIQLASQPLPERPDGIVCVVKYSSARDDCRATEAEYERLARDNPATIFLRCMEEYENAALLMGQANVQNWPTFDVFYGGNRVARVEGCRLSELTNVLNMYQMQNSKLDLFSEDASEYRQMPRGQWGGGGGSTRDNVSKTPRTTNRFVPGYDWNKKGGFFDEQGAKAEQSFEDTFGNWVPNIDDDDQD